MGAFKDLTQQKFGKLTAISYYRKHNRVYWRCECDCGNKIDVRSDGLTTGQTKSCGCLHREIVTKVNTTHGKCNTRLYDSWTDLKQRCYNKHNKRYKDYGGRGIEVCDEWRNNFQAFYDWAMSNGYNDSLTIDRIDVDGNYEPSNCRWATLKQQLRNTTRNKYITINGMTHCLSEWCEILGLKDGTVRSRLRYGWSIEKALELEVK